MPGSKAGTAMASGDFNGDSSTDLVIGAYNFNSGDGKAYVVYRPYANISLSLADASFTGGVQEQLGYSVAAGNINSDIYDDILLGAQNNTYVVYGDSTVRDIDATLLGSGKSLAIGDLNNDGFGDAIVGGTEIVYVVFGPFNGTVSLDVESDASYMGINLGSEVRVGDLNGDDVDDLIMGGLDMAFIIYGPISSGLGQPADAIADVVLMGLPGSSAGKYHTISTGDVNNDTYDDILIGAPYDTSAGGSWSGRAFLVYGSANLSGTIDLDTHATQFLPENIDDSAGYSTAILDYDQDGYGDVVVSSPGNDEAGNLAGKVYLFYGPVAEQSHNLASADLSWTGTFAGDSIGIVQEGSLIIGQMDEAMTDYVIYVFDYSEDSGNYSNQTGECRDFPNLKAYWSFDSDANDVTGNTNDGQVMGAVRVTGIAGNAYDFDGIDDQIYVPNPEGIDFPTEAFTVSYWIKPDSLDGTFVFDKSDVPTTSGYLSFLLGSGWADFEVASGSAWQGIFVDSGAQVGQWKHLVFVHDSSTGEHHAYVDGQYVTTQSGVTHLSSTADLVIGNFHPEMLNSKSNIYPFDGAIDEFAIFEGALDAAQIEEIYDKGIAGVGVCDSFGELVADAGGPYTAEEGEAITLNGSGSYDFDGVIVSYEWDLNEDGVFNDSIGAEAVFQCGYYGIYPVSLKVTDDAGWESIDTAEVNCSDVPTSVDTGGPYIYTPNEPFNMTANASDPGMPPDIYVYEWDINGDNEYDLSGQTVTVEFNETAPGVVKVKVTPINSTPYNFTIIVPVEVTPVNDTCDECIDCPEACTKPSQPELKDPLSAKDTGNQTPENDTSKIPLTYIEELTAKPIVCGPYSQGTYADSFFNESSRSLNGIFSPSNAVSGLNINALSNQSIGSSVGDLFISPIFSQQEASNWDCPPDHVCGIGGQCIPVCDEGGHLIITEIAKDWVEIYNPNPRHIKLDNYALQGVSFPKGAVVGAKEYIVATNNPNATTDLNSEIADYYLESMVIDAYGGAIVLSYDDFSEVKIVDYVPYGMHATADLEYALEDTAPLEQHVVYLPQRAVYNQLILTELVGDWNQRLYYAEITNIHNEVVKTDNIELEFLAGDDYFYGTMPVILMAPGESIVIEFESVFVNKSLDPNDLGPILQNGSDYWSFENFTNTSKTALLGYMPFIEFTLYKVLNISEVAELNLSEWFNQTEINEFVESNDSLFDVLEYFADNVDDILDLSRGRFVYKNAVQNTFEQSVLNFRPGDFLKAEDHSLGIIEYFDFLKSNDISSVPVISLGSNESAQFSMLNDLFNRPCHKILLEEEAGDALYDACNAVKDYPSYEYISLNSTPLTLQRLIFEEDEKQGGRGLDGKDPTSEKVDEHFDWLVATQGGGLE